jgi:POT family proton-dependent oligopeptide transporter
VKLPPQTGFFGHPAGLRTLFFAEMWERFSYYGMRALLVLFMTAPIATGGLGWDTSQAGSIYGMYTSLVYLVALPGGWIADRIIGARKSVLWGGIIIMMGHIVLTLPSLTSFFIGLLLVIIGTGFLKPNISVMVGQLYASDDERRDAGFSIYYMGINLGALLAPLVTGYLAQSAGWQARLAGWGIDPERSWHWGFGAAAVGMALGLIWYVVDAKAMGEAGIAPAPSSGAEEDAANIRKVVMGAVGVVGVVAALFGLHASGIYPLSIESLNAGFGIFLLLVVIGFFSWLFLGNEWTGDERHRLILIGVLFLGASVFWSIFEQTGSTLNLFADRSTRNELFGNAFPSSWWQSVNSLWIITLAPIFAWLWVKLGHRAPGSTAKFAIGLLFVGLSFIWMVPAAIAAGRGELVGWWWLLICYFLQTVGELCLSPIGLSAMTKLAPQRVMSLMMGVWFMAVAVGSFIGGNVSGLYDSFDLPTLFGAVGIYGLVFAGVFFLLVKPIGRMMSRS